MQFEYMSFNEIMCLCEYVPRLAEVLCTALRWHSSFHGAAMHNNSFGNDEVHSA